MMAPGELLNGVALCGSPVTRIGRELMAGDRRVGRVHDHERRLEWVLPLEPRLEQRVAVERRLFDARSLLRKKAVTPIEPAPMPTAWLDLGREPSPLLRALFPQEPVFDGARILELGGSGEATRGFLRAGAARIDQLDVSPGMQELGRARLAPHERDRVVQHTAPAERLPFADGTFDLVFSRHCLHHMHRPDVVPEAARVLKPTGSLLLIEPYLPAQVRLVMHARRRLRAVERGTDDPLGARDLALFGSWFASVRTRGRPALTPLLRLRKRPRVLARLARLERSGGLPPSWLHLVGGRVAILARRPRQENRAPELVPG